MSGLRFDRLAFTGGGMINQIGSLEDVICFFKLAQDYATSFLSDADRILIQDRLYRRYIRLDQTTAAIEAMGRLQRHFSEIRTSDVNWSDYNIPIHKTTFKFSQNDVAGVVSHFFSHFSECANSALYNSNTATHQFYRPVRISRSDFGSLDREDKRPLEEYDALDGPPFWLAGT